MSISKEQIARINELARKNKSPEGLTEAELAERDLLRRAYIDSVKDSLRAQVETTKFVNAAGQDITPDKLKKIQRDKGLRSDDKNS